MAKQVRASDAQLSPSSPAALRKSFGSPGKAREIWYFAFWLLSLGKLTIYWFVSKPFTAKISICHMSLSAFVLCALVQHSSAAHSSSCFPRPIWSWWRNTVVDFWSALWGSSPGVLCSQGPDVLLGEPAGPSQTGAWSKAPWKQWRDWWGFA